MECATWFLYNLNEEPSFEESAYILQTSPPNQLQKLNSMIKWAQIQSLTHISFHGQLDQEQLDALTRFDQLLYLTVENAVFPLESLPELTKLKGLITKRITLPPAASFPDCHSKLASMDKLRIIEPLNWDTTRTLLKKPLPCLHTFGLDDAITEAMIKEVRTKAPNLSSITLVSSSKIAWTWLIHFRPPIRRLSVEAQISVDAKVIKRQLANFEEVILKDCELVADFNFLTFFKKLKMLELRKTPRLSEAHQLTTLFQNEALIKLDLSGASILDDKLLNKFYESHLCLEHFIARRSAEDDKEGFTDDGLRHYLYWDRNSQLKTLDVAGHTGITNNPFLVDPAGATIACISNLVSLGVRYTGVTNSAIVDHLLVSRDIWMRTSKRTSGKTNTTSASKKGPSDEAEETGLKNLDVHLSSQWDRQSSAVPSRLYPDANLINVWFYDKDRRSLYPGPDSLTQMEKIDEDKENSLTYYEERPFW
jgi:hypothetical protein